MARGWWLRLTLLTGLCAAAGLLLYPSYLYFFRASEAERESNAAFCKSLPGWMPCAKLNLGLDLQGGVHLVMGVRLDKALEHRADRLGEALQEALEAHKLPRGELRRPPGGHRLELVGLDAAQLAEAERLARRELPALVLVARDAAGVSWQLSEAEVAYVQQSAVEQSIKTIRNRADKLGVTEPTIAQRGQDQVLIQLPGVKDPEHAIDIIGRTAQLEFIMADGPANGALVEAMGGAPLPPGVQLRRVGVGSAAAAASFWELPEEQAEALRAAVAPHMPPHVQLAFGPASSPQGVERAGFVRSWLLEARPNITGDALDNAQVQENRELAGDYFVTMTFDADGAKTFERLTAAHVGDSMAIVLDGKVVSAPTISEKIAGGTARITLGRSADPQRKFQEAKDLVLVLKAGALPAPVEVREKRQVGKTLGQDTVQRGAWAMATGTLLVVAFMAVYYRLSGMLANLALVLNVLLMLAVLALCEATLTLPGMAGMVLTIGMAVDANVLIFERIREELRAGRSPKVAIDAGYRKAFGTIFDSNVTTLIAGVVLMEYGSGPVRGFAVTLIIGLTCSLYTAIVVTRLAYDYMTRRGLATSLSI